MSNYTSINKLAEELNRLNIPIDDNFEELIPLLELMEKVNPCNQEYELSDNCLVMYYSLKLNLFNFKNILPFRAKVQIIGLPVSVCLKGYFGDNNNVEKIINTRKGLKILLNADFPFKRAAKTLSSFVFENKFISFEEYLNSLRSPYRRRINQALKHRNEIIIRKLSKHEFSLKHYDLYLSIMKRTDNPLETLSAEFFKEYDAELYEFVDKETYEILGFIQIKEIKNKLYFLFGGFRKDDVAKYDIYYNMLLKIIEIGIEKQVTEIEFGQTAEESKLKIGCIEKYKYMYVHHSNLIFNFFLQKLVPCFSYKPYTVRHHAFKAEG